VPHLRPSYVDHKPAPDVPRVSFLALQHLRIEPPFLPHSVARMRPKAVCPDPRKCRTQGLATLSTVYLAPARSSEASFSSQRSWGSPFKALLLFHDRKGLPDPFSPLLRFPRKPPGLLPTLQWLAPMKKAVSLFAPRRISPGRNRLLSWAFWPLRRSLPLPDLKSFSLFKCPSRPSSRHSHKLRYWNLRGFRGHGLGSLPPKRAPACLTFLTDRRLP
jgi:hypothetical protein